MSIPNKLSILFAFVLLAGMGTLNAQTINVTDANYDAANPLDCGVFSNGAVANFFDDGAAANYSNNFNDTITICPDLSLGSKVTISFAINVGFTWDVDSTDTLFVYDGPNTSAPLLGAHNSVTNPNGFNHQASFFNNPSGCLTIVFKSDSAGSGTGWDANVTCGNPPQPFNPHMIAYQNGPGNGDTLSPLDTGRVEVCLGDSVLFVGSADFPFSLENTGTGYSQTDTNVTYKWFFSNGEIIVGDSIWFHPPGNAGYVVTLQVTDAFPSAQQLVSSVRVAPRIDFSSTRALRDSICPGDSVVLIAGVNPFDTVGVSPTVSITEVGGSFAGLTYLPDGSGTNYEATINITGFGIGQTLQSGMDILRLAITMEHSFLGDLEMLLICPSGDSAAIFNAYNGAIGMIPGGFGGGGTFLGDAFDNNIANPGIGWTYSFSDSTAVWGTMGAELALGNTVPATTFSNGIAMNPDSVYLPEESFNSFIGCPVNGTWKLVIRDNQGIDDGYIFDWAIFFNPYINPNFESYTTSLVSSAWYDDFGNAIGIPTDTIQYDFPIPDSTGFNYYNFEVMDEYGCKSDTTLPIYTTPVPTSTELDTSSCNNQIAIEVYSADSVHWSVFSGNPAGISFLPNSIDTNVIVEANEHGTFGIDMTIFSNNCVFNDTATLFFYDDIPQDLFRDTAICEPNFMVVPAIDDSTRNYTYAWGPNGETTDSIEVTETGVYYLTVSGCNIVTDSISVRLFEKPNIISEALVCDSQIAIGIDTTNLGGFWSVVFDSTLSGNILSDFTTDSLYLSTDSRGTVVYSYSDSICATVDTQRVVFNHEPAVSIIDSLICIKDAPLTLKSEVYPLNDQMAYIWSDNSRDSILDVYTYGLVKLKVENSCGVAEDTVTVKFKDCLLEVPNVFTPNNDGINDEFILTNRQYYNSVETMIYNRWGIKVYNSKNRGVTWDGLDNGGKLCSDGTYFFVVIVDGEKETGSLTLISGN